MNSAEIWVNFDVNLSHDRYLLKVASVLTDDSGIHSNHISSAFTIEMIRPMLVQVGSLLTRSLTHPLTRSLTLSCVRACVCVCVCVSLSRSRSLFILSLMFLVSA